MFEHPVTKTSPAKMYKLMSGFPLKTIFDVIVWLDSLSDPDNALPKNRKKNITLFIPNFNSTKKPEFNPF